METNKIKNKNKNKFVCPYIRNIRKLITFNELLKVIHLKSN